MTGRTISHYQILEKLGEGGMGVVYKARDSHLDRFVAIKVLPPEKVADPERKLRFVQEAKAASALNHPNIVHVYDIDEQDGLDYIAMEYVQGKTLGQLIGRKGLKLSEALKYGVQIADALGRAHAAGIVHRDLKPGNIMVDEHGLVKVLDFGLAKLTEAVPLSEEEPTRTMRPATEEGTILGTVSYMSPEQAEGKPLDTRSDIFSFGAVLYEMLTGNRAFQKDSKTSTLAAILTQEPTPLGGEIPHDVERVVSRCLRKDVARRYQHMDDVKATLAELKEESESGKLKAPTRAPARVSRLVLVLAFLAVATAGGVAWRLTRSATPPAAPVLTRLTFDSGLTTDPALSPDGKLLAYASDRAGEGNLDIWVKQVGGGEPVRVTRDAADEREPAFSSDGTTIAFRSEGKEDGVYVVSALGGSPRKIAPGGRGPRFSPAGDLVAYSTGEATTAMSAHFGTGGYMRAYVVHSTGGAPRQIQPSFAAVLFPDWSPDGKHLLFLGKPDDASDAEESVDWWVTPVEGGTAVLTGITEAVRTAGLTGPSQIYPWMLVSPAWQPDGGAVIFSARSGDTINLWRFGITPKTWQVTGQPARLTSGTTREESPAAAVGTGGAVRVAFASLNLNSDIWALELDWVQGRPRSQPRPLIVDASDDSSPHLSADGKKIVFLSTRSGSQQVWIRDFETGMDTALTAIRSQKITVRLSPDASRVSFSSLEDNRWNIYVVPSTGGVQELICSDCGHLTGWSPDGNWAFYNDVRGRAGVIETGSRRKIELFVQPGKFVCCGGFSPDGRWIHFWASGRTHVVPFQTEGVIAEAAWGEALAIGFHIVRWWGPGGRWLLLAGQGSWWAQRLDPATKRPAGAPVAIYNERREPESGTFQAGPPSRPGPDTVVFTREHRSGNIWMAEFTP